MTSTGIILLLLAGFAQGSFGLGMKKQKPLSWEAFWLIYSFVAMLIVPIIWGYTSTDQFFTAIFATDGGTLATSILLGFLWGIGGILFGVSVNYVGVSITNGIVMGLAGGLGAIIPLLGVEGATEDSSFIFVVIGVLIMILGVVISAYAGMIRDKEQNHENIDVKTTHDFKKGLIIVITSGVLSALLNVGFEAANPVVANATALGASDMASSLPARAVVVFGGLLMNAGYAIYLLCKNNTWGDFGKVASSGYSGSTVWASITGILWFLPLGLAGIVSVSIGELGNVITWPVMLALSLIFGNIWGYVTGEWKGAKRSFVLMIAASAILIIACLMLTFKEFLA
ncbi:MAG: L-rhamnose/proton symporter RhaT [Rikenellaceae bacterium]